MYRFLIVSSLILLSFQAALAHDYWLRPWQSGVELAYGHDQESAEYKKSVLQAMGAYSAEGKRVAGEAVFFQGTFRLEAPKAQAFTAIVDDGPWIKTVRGWKRGSKKGQGKVLRSTWDRHYAKYVTGKGKALGLPLEIVLDEVDGTLGGTVVFQGKPLPGAALEINHKKVAQSDSKGRFQLAGRTDKLLILRVAHSQKLENNADADWSQHICTLTLKR